MNNSIKLTLFGLILYIFITYINNKNKKKNNTKVDTPPVQNTNDDNVEPSPPVQNTNDDNVEPSPIVSVALMPEKVATNAFTEAVNLISNTLPKVTHQMLADRYTPPKKKVKVHIYPELIADTIIKKMYNII